MSAESISRSRLIQSTWDFHHWIPGEKFLKIDYLLGPFSRLVSEVNFQWGS